MKPYIEKRIRKSYLSLKEANQARGVQSPQAEDLAGLSIASLPPALRISYVVVGLVIVVFGIWVQRELGNMAISILIVITGFANIAFAAYGKPRLIGQLASEEDLKRIAGSNTP